MSRNSAGQAISTHDANLSRIREDIATTEATDRLLKDTPQPLPQHRRDTLESVRAKPEKNDTTTTTAWSASKDSGGA